MVKANAWRNREALAVFAFILCGALAIILTAWSIRTLTHETWGESFGRAWVLVASALLVFNLGHHAWFKLRSGLLLLDIRPNPARSLSLLCSLIFLGANLFGGELSETTQLMREGDGFELLSAALTYLLLPIFWVLIAFSRFQFRQRGIWHYANLIPWQRVHSYHWQDDDTLVISLRFRGLEREQTYDIPDEKVRTLKELLETRLGQQAQTL